MEMVINGGGNVWGMYLQINKSTKLWLKMRKVIRGVVERQGEKLYCRIVAPKEARR